MLRARGSITLRTRNTRLYTDLTSDVLQKGQVRVPTRIRHICMERSMNVEMLKGVRFVRVVTREP